jgi:hypothetical protein
LRCHDFGEIQEKPELVVHCGIYWLVGGGVLGQPFRAVHWVRYSPQYKLHIASAGDDRTVRWWDVATQVLGCTICNQDLFIGGTLSLVILFCLWQFQLEIASRCDMFTV